MTAPKNPYTFTDEILVRELRRLARKGSAAVEQQADDRLDFLLEVVYQRLWERDYELQTSKNALTLQRLRRLEKRQAETIEMAERMVADTGKLLGHTAPRRPDLTLIRGDTS